MRRLFAFVLLTALAIPAWSDDFDTTIRPFLKDYCVRCHGVEKQKGDRRFDELPATIKDADVLIDFQDIVDQLNLGEMPPKKANAQPDAATRQKVVDLLSRQISAFHKGRKGTRETVLRRLNAREYRNTVRDLLNVNTTTFDPTAHFPKDQTDEHLDNLGDTLVTSGHLLQRYLEAADQIVEKTVGTPQKPPVQTWSFTGPFKQQQELDSAHKKAFNQKYMVLYDVIGADKHEGAYGYVREFEKGVPHDGFYEIKLKVEALNRQHPYDRTLVGTDPAEPFRLGVRPGNYHVGDLHRPQPIEPLLTEVTLPDELTEVTVKVWLDAGQTPRFTFRNGIMDVRSLYGKVIRKHKDMFPPGSGGGIVDVRNAAIKHGKLPQIRIHKIDIKGPLYEQWPTAGQRAVLGDDWEAAVTGELPDSIMRKHLGAFASRAYRRPAANDEIDRLLNLAKVRRDGGRTPLQAYGDALKAVLCSPSFLYLEEAGKDKLSAYDIASRLSYFLWSSMPDTTLLQLAADGSLTKPTVMQQQVERMLKDSRSNAFIDGFLGSWLNLRELGSTPPDRAAFRAYYKYDLGDAMRQESHLFTRHLIDEDQSITNFLDSDFTFVNRRLAEHYGLARLERTDAQFERVALKDRRRGGLLGQASVLTVSANGVDTSPIVRGVWLLENILGTPPTPPPPDVEPLDPDVRGAKTVRDQLEKHRTIATCNDCHRKIDPLGFALENFDPVGGWRDTYARRRKIDASGSLPTGETFKDVTELKTILLNRKTLFARGLTSKLMAYATGRHVGPLDRPHIDAILADLEANGDGFRRLITQTVLSEPFRTP
jgi:hypothetical protein